MSGSNIVREIVRQIPALGVGLFLFGSGVVAIRHIFWKQRQKRPLTKYELLMILKQNTHKDIARHIIETYFNECDRFINCQMKCTHAHYETYIKDFDYALCICTKGVNAPCSNIYSKTHGLKGHEWCNKCIYSGKT